MDHLGEHDFWRIDPELILDEKGGRAHGTEHKPSSGDACGI